MRAASDVTLLIVDDEPALREALLFDFKRRGYNVVGAENGRQALEVVRKQKVDLVLSDVRMPDGDGVELLDAIKAIDPGLPILMFITGFADLTLDEAYDKGADAVFAKPFDRKVLSAAVQKAVTNKEELWGCRQTERLAASFEIDLQFEEFSNAVHGKVMNLGRGGIFVALNDQFPSVETKVSFVIRFKEGPLASLAGEGIVRWTRSQVLEGRQTGCGIEFEFVNDDARKPVLELLERMKTRAFIPKG